MDQTQRQMMREALFGVGFKEAQISSFADATLDKLCAANFHASGRLQSATREDLKDAGLAPGDVGFIMGKVQGTRGSFRRMVSVDFLLRTATACQSVS